FWEAPASTGSLRPTSRRRMPRRPSTRRRGWRSPSEGQGRYPAFAVLDDASVPRQDQRSGEPDPEARGLGSTHCSPGDNHAPPKGGYMAQPARSKATRRDFLKLAAGATGVAAGPWVSRHAQAKPVSITFARESSYVKNFDVHFQNVMAPAYEKATGIKIEYQIQAAAGSAVPQLVSMGENKSGADLAWAPQEGLYRDALVDVSDIAEEVGKQQGGWYDESKRRTSDKGKWKTVHQANIGQLRID